MAKKEWTDPFPNLPRGGNLARRAERAPATERIEKAKEALAQPKPKRVKKPARGDGL